MKLPEQGNSDIIERTIKMGECMALGIPELGGNNILNDDERLILQQEAEIASQQTALQTAQSVEAFSEISVDKIRESLPLMSEKQRRKVLNALRIASCQIAKYVSSTEADDIEHTALPERTDTVPPEDHPALVLVATQPEQDRAAEEPSTEPAVAESGATDLPVVPQESLEATDSTVTNEPEETVGEIDRSPEVEVTAIVESGETQQEESILAPVVEPEPDSTEKTPIKFDPERLAHFGRRISRHWNGVDYPLADPLTSDEAIGLISERYFRDFKPESDEYIPYADRLTAILEGKPFKLIAEEESALVGHTVKPSAVGVFLSSTAPLAVRKFFKELPSNGESSTDQSEKSMPVLQESEPTAEAVVLRENTEQASSLTYQPQPAQAVEFEATPIEDIEVPAEVNLELSSEGDLTAEHIVVESEVSTLHEQDAFLEPTAGVDEEIAPVAGENEVEVSELQQSIEKQKTDYDSVIAEMLIDDMQTDGQKRHKKGYLDPRDIAEAYGLHESTVRAVYDRLKRDGKLSGLPKPLPLEREKGRQTGHYQTAVLYILLPAVAEEAAKIHGIVSSDSRNK